MKNIAAALIFFTRLPWWRISLFKVSNEHFKQVINYWSVVGWLTSLVMATIFYYALYIFPLSIALMLAIASRLLITGCLHEDGLADFFDGFGGGTTKERTLDIMKDSHIGTYGVISLIFYFVLLYSALANVDTLMACSMILVADPLCKFISSQITLFLPYARNEETSKAKVVYDKMSCKSLIISAIFGLVPLFYLFSSDYWVVALVPVIVFALLIWLMKSKIQGYTGDCCGAMFLLCELSFYLGIIALRYMKVYWL